MFNENLNPLLKAFQEQKVSKQNTELLVAQRLVNLYRSLHCFKPEFVDEYNQLLLSATVEEKRVLSTLMGGSEVRSYLDFLQQQFHQNQNADSSQQNQNKGYLPNPDQDEVASDTSENIHISKEEWHKMQEQQRLLMEQTQLLADSVKNVKQVAQGVEKQPMEMGQNYSDIIEDEG